MIVEAAAPAVPVYDHLHRLSDATGVHEHADHDLPRAEHGYCVDDVARALVVCVREPDATPELHDLAARSLRFVEAAISTDGTMHNRMDHGGAWTDLPRMGDWWGRAVGALGTAAANGPTADLRQRSALAFDRLVTARPHDVRTSVFAAIGAAELLRSDPAHSAARALLRHCLMTVPSTSGAPWAWPEARLRYANGTLPEALIFGGAVLGDALTVRRGVRMLAFLLHTETTRTGALSVTGTEGRGPRERGRQFDQQPIEVGAIADACARAYEVTGHRRWLEGIRRAWAWFEGENDVGIPMYDHRTGAGFDGLRRDGRNENRGAESTLAALSTFQHARRLRLVGAAQALGSVNYR